MNRRMTWVMVGTACIAAWNIVSDSKSGLGQRLPPAQRSGILGPRGELGSRISGERTTRQAEVLRLQESIDQLQARVRRLERMAVSGGEFPAFTIEESEAELAFAEIQLAARLRALEEGEANEVQVAADRLQLARAKSQLALAQAAYADRRLELESDVADARRKLIEETKQQEQLQRLVAKGYASTEGWELQQVNVELAKNHLLRAQSRLNFYQRPGASQNRAEPESGGPAPTADAPRSDSETKTDQAAE
jgi:hypothetical protein